MVDCLPVLSEMTLYHNIVYYPSTGVVIGISVRLVFDGDFYRVVIYVITAFGNDGVSGVLVYTVSWWYIIRIYNKF